MHTRTMIAVAALAVVSGSFSGCSKQGNMNGDGSSAGAAMILKQQGLQPLLTSEVTLYEDCSYGGWSASFSPGVYDMADLASAGGVNDDASSLDVPPGMQVTVYTDNDLGGRSAFFSANDPCLINDGINDSISSLIVGTNVTLQADGPGNTYELINSVLGGTAEETPDCAHPAFGRHISEQYDSALNEPVFAFHIHVTPDNDRCVNFDRQRCEIKTYGPSPDAVKAFDGDDMVFQWKFKLASGFQPSYSFTHIHQIKAGDGPNDGSPIITLTPRYGSPDQLQIIHNGNSSATSLGTVAQVDLSSFKGTWVEATEHIVFGHHGTYSLVLKRISDGAVLMSYSNNDIDMWRTGSTFVRPKWGIYRSLNHAEQLRDETVLFADFLIGKN